MLDTDTIPAELVREWISESNTTGFKLLFHSMSWDKLANLPESRFTPL